MAVAMPQANGHKRPSLAEQINRLDKTLDGLADGLNDAVADAVRSAVGTAVRVAVQEVLTEVFTNPDILAKLHPVPVRDVRPVEPAPEPPRWGILCQTIRTCFVGTLMVGAMLSQQVQHTTGRYWREGVHHLTRLASRWQMIRRFKYEILMALGIGVAVGMSAWYAGPWFSALTSGIGGFVTTLSVQAGVWLRKMFAVDIEQLA